VKGLSETDKADQISITRRALVGSSRNHSRPVLNERLKIFQKSNRVEVHPFVGLFPLMMTWMLFFISHISEFFLIDHYLAAIWSEKTLLRSRD